MIGTEELYQLTSPAIVAPTPDVMDTDGDGIPDNEDNCPTIVNASQTDSDGDGLGDVCDNCILVANTTQADFDGDAIGDACDRCPFDVANDADNDGVCGDVDLCPGTVADAPTIRLLVDRFAQINLSTPAFETVLPKGVGPKKSFTIDQTRGCSCAQIIDALGLGEGHRQFGCSISAMEDWIASLPPLPNSLVVHHSEPVATFIPPPGPVCTPTEG